MISLNKILVPTDFSEHGAKAARYGAELAEKFDAELHLVHAVEPLAIMYGEGGGYVPAQTAAELEATAVKELAAVKNELNADITVVQAVLDGHAFVEIVRYAKENQIDLIVVGTHGRGAIAHVLLGSVAEKVVRKAPCPVLVVRDGEHDFVMP